MTGIYQPNLFRTLPNRPRLHGLISIFDSEEQQPGSIIRSRQSSPSNLEGVGAATSLHLESTPDICALLASYLSALPEPILPLNLFEAVWTLCDLDKQPLTESQPAPITSPDPSAPVRLSSVALARSYTPRCEATYISCSCYCTFSPPHTFPCSSISFLSPVRSRWSEKKMEWELKICQKCLAPEYSVRGAAMRHQAQHRNHTPSLEKPRARRRRETHEER